jgi:hypothetical protein
MAKKKKGGGGGTGVGLVIMILIIILVLGSATSNDPLQTAIDTVQMWFTNHHH